MLRATSGGSGPKLLAASAVAQDLTGTLSETAQATVSIPAGAMGTGGGIEVRSVWSNNNSANAKTMRVRFGGLAGTAYLSTSNTTAITLSDTRRIRNRGAANSQVGAFSSVVGAMGSSTVAVVTSAVDTLAAVNVVISGQLANVGDTLTLESYEVWLLP